MAESDDECPLLVEAPITPLQNAAESLKRVPVTIVTGFLGSGKTTLMSYLLTAAHGKRIAIILNDFGEGSAIDKSVLLIDSQKSDTPFEDWLELPNGCLCCPAKGAGVIAIENLMKKRGKFDYVLLETTGLADPGPIASMFWLDDGLNADLYLDGIITMVDAAHGQQQLASQASHSSSTSIPDIGDAVRQVALADRIIVNKVSESPPNALEELISSIRSLNSSAPMIETNYSKVDVEFLLDIHAYESCDFNLTSFLSTTHHHHHDEDVEDPNKVHTVAFDVCGEVDDASLDAWIQALIWDKHIPSTESASHFAPVHILRLKGIAAIKGVQERVVFQAVNEYFDKKATTAWETEPRVCRVVAIGRGISQETLKASFVNILLKNV